MKQNEMREDYQTYINILAVIENAIIKILQVKLIKQHK